MKLRWSETARHDLESILSYIAEHNRQAAASVASRILDRAQMLEQFPLAGHRTDMAEVRALSVARYPYIIFYVIDAAANEVTVVSVRHTSRDQPTGAD